MTGVPEYPPTPTPPQQEIRPGDMVVMLVSLTVPGDFLSEACKVGDVALVERVCPAFYPGLVPAIYVMCLRTALPAVALTGWVRRIPGRED